MIISADKKCKYYPCHEAAEIDCRLCYCPFYNICQVMPEILLKKYGIKGYWLKSPRVWACEKCTFPHQEKIADYYYKYKEDMDLKDLFFKCLKLAKGDEL